MKRANERALRGDFKRLLHKYETELVFDVSDELKFTRKEAIDVYKCANWVAIGKLQRHLKELKIKTIAKLFELGPDSLLRIEGVGTVTVYVAMCILDRYNYSVDDWWGWTKEAGARQAKRHAHPDTATMTSSGAST